VKLREHTKFQKVDTELRSPWNVFDRKVMNASKVCALLGKGLLLKQKVYIYENNTYYNSK